VLQDSLCGSGCQEEFSENFLLDFSITYQSKESDRVEYLLSPHETDLAHHTLYLVQATEVITAFSCFFLEREVGSHPSNAPVLERGNAK